MNLLDKESYHKASKALLDVKINTLFARAVLEGQVNGKVYVDDPEHPETFYVIHPYTMTLLYGKPDNKEFNQWFKDHALNIYGLRDHHEWMQAYPAKWDYVLKDLFGDKLVLSVINAGKTDNGVIELNTRINLTLDPAVFQSSNVTIPDDVEVVRTSGDLYKKITGAVIPHHFFRDEEHFENEGVAYTVLYKGEIASTAFGAFNFEKQLEFGIETVETFRGKGFAELASRALAEWCVENGYEALWACRLENASSFRLALRMGFKVTAEIPYYRLCN